MDAHALTDVLAERAAIGRSYLEFRRSNSLSVGLYVLDIGDTDRQQPHLEDEVYVVMRGRGRFTAGGKTRDVTPGDVIFVAAQAPHHFHDVTTRLELIVVFAPPETPPEAVTQGV